MLVGVGILVIFSEVYILFMNHDHYSIAWGLTCGVLAIFA